MAILFQWITLVGITASKQTARDMIIRLTLSKVSMCRLSFHRQSMHGEKISQDKNDQKADFPSICTLNRNFFKDKTT